MKTIISLMLLVAGAVANDLGNTDYSKPKHNFEALRDVLTCVVDNDVYDIGEHCKDLGSDFEEALQDGCEECGFAKKQFPRLLFATAKAQFPDLYEEFKRKFGIQRKLIDKIDDEIKEF